MALRARSDTLPGRRNKANRRTTRLEQGMNLKICLAVTAFATAAAFALFNFAPAAEGGSGSDDESFVEIDCGEEIPLPGGYPVEEGDAFLVKTFKVNSDGSHEDAIDAFLSDTNAQYTALLAGIIKRAEELDHLHPYVCTYCAVPNHCRVWVTAWNPAPGATFAPLEVPGSIEIWATIVSGGVLTLSCTDC
jgi:hypothetical protein